MVMDATPSPQCVGREFVRQYYTLLNEAPQYLHRFYSHNSSFIHGGDSKGGEEQKPTIGQAEIHKKIMSLNFKDCHAKIRYVDSQSTIATAVVVQVTGELSNDQAPLRRFMQTFVLAPQSANKYYVHNDIFRYQDEVFSDSDEEDELVEEQQVAQPPQSTTPEHTSQPAAADQLRTNTHHYQQLNSEVDLEVNGGHVSTAEPVMSNGHSERPVTPPTVEEPQAPSAPEPVVEAAAPEPAVVENVEPAPGRVAVHPPAHQPLPEEGEAGAPAKPRSWANIAHTNAAVAPPGVAPASHPTGVFPNAPAEQPVMDTPTPAPHRPPLRNNRSAEHKVFGDAAHSRRSDEGTGGEDRRVDRGKYPDCQQVFVGNLPGTISDFELKAYFKSYGTVVEVRINRSSPNKLPFGFVVFDNEASARSVLAFKSLDYNGHRLNIEEKKPRNDSRNHSGSRHGGRPRHMRSGGRGGYNPSREDSGGRGEHGRINNISKGGQHRR